MNKQAEQPPCLAFIAYSGTGKTTLLQHIIRQLSQQGLTLTVMKHTHHDIDIDQPNKDSYLLRKAGAKQTVIASRKRWAMINEMVDTEQNRVACLLAQLPLKGTDLVLIEGFKSEKLANIVLTRQTVNRAISPLINEQTIAIASDYPIKTIRLPRLDINQPMQICQFIEQWLIKDKKVR